MDAEAREAVHHEVRQHAEDVLAGVEDRWDDVPRIDPLRVDPLPHQDDSTFPESVDAFLDEFWLHAAGCAVVDDDGRLLCQQNVVRDSWETPGGAGESGETPEDTAVRETREETGVECDLTGVLCARYLEMDLGFPETLPVPFVEFTGRRVGGEVIGDDELAAHDETVEISWFRADTLPETISAYEQKHEFLSSLEDG